MRIPLGDFACDVEVREECLVAGRRAVVAPDVRDLRGAIREALERPRHFPPLRRALTPEDRVALIIDEQLPQLGICISEILTYLQESGIDLSAVTLVSPKGSRQSWIDELPDSVQAAGTEIHDPSNRQALCYLASTQGGRRIYLNRTVVEADLAIVLTGCRYDSENGVYGAAQVIFPALSDEPTLQDSSSRSLAEASEVAWLLGVPFLVQIVEGSGEQAAHVVGGTIESIADCEQLLQARWRIPFERPAEIVVATMNGDPARHDFVAVARAAQAAASVCEVGGKIVLLTRAAPSIGPWIDLIRDAANPAEALLRLQKQASAVPEAAISWFAAARQASIYWLTPLDEDLVEELFAVPLARPQQVQRLIDAARSCLFLDDAHKALPVIE